MYQSQKIVLLFPQISLSWTSLPSNLPLDLSQKNDPAFAHLSCLCSLFQPLMTILWMSLDIFSNQSILTASLGVSSPTRSQDDPDELVPILALHVADLLQGGAHGCSQLAPDFQLSVRGRHHNVTATNS